MQEQRKEFEPEAWPELVQHAARTLRDYHVSYAQMRRVFRVLDELDNPTLEENRYHGLGLAVCELAKLLVNPQAQAELVRAGAQHIVERHGGYCKENSLDPIKGLRVGELADIHFAPGVLKVCNVATSNMEPSELFLSDMLGCVHRERLAGLRPKDFKDHYKRVENISYRTQTAIALSGLLHGASYLTVAALRDLHYKKTGSARTVSEEDHKDDPPLYSVVSDAEFRRFNMQAIAMSIARLRYDEGLSIAGSVEVDLDGVVYARGPSILENPDLLPQDLVGDAGEGPALLHSRRLGCPALYAEAMIPLVLKLMPDIAAAAHEGAIRDAIYHSR